MPAETTNDTVRRLMADAAASYMRDPAAIIRAHTGARLTRLPLNELGREGHGWLMESERLDEPVMFTDAALADYATKLDAIFG